MQLYPYNIIYMIGITRSNYDNMLLNLYFSITLNRCAISNG